jgi:transporter family-2 protein
MTTVISNVSLYLLLPLSVLVGFSLASQAGINAQLRLALSSPMQAAFISFFIGTIILGIIVFIQEKPWFKPNSLFSLPWWI